MKLLIISLVILCSIATFMGNKAEKCRAMKVESLAIVDAHKATIATGVAISQAELMVVAKQAVDYEKQCS